MLYSDWVQHPIGKGGFHSGCINFDDRYFFDWVFDCGSIARKRLDKYIDNWNKTQRKKLDWLFISHFDLDHVSGLDTLLTGRKTNNVVIPYVHNAQLAMLLLQSITKKRYKKDFIIDMVANPILFFSENQLIENVILIYPTLPTDEFRGVEQENPTGIDQSPFVTTVSAIPYKPESDSKGKSHTISKKAMCFENNLKIKLCIGECVIFKFEVHMAPMEMMKLECLIDELIDCIKSSTYSPDNWGLGLLSHDIVEYTKKNERNRKKIKNIYERYTHSSNESSISLLSTPKLPFGHKEKGFHLICNNATFSTGVGVSGWINTGDAVLTDSSDNLENWIKSFDSEFESVKAVALPHHGSAKNSGAEFNKLFRYANFLAHSRENDKYHPGSNIIKITGDKLVCITENPCTIFWMRYRYCHCTPVDEPICNFDCFNLWKVVDCLKLWPNVRIE